MKLKKEKRERERTPFNEIVRFQANDASIAGGTPAGEVQTATVVDISATGMGIITKAPLKKGQIIHFVADQPNWELPAKAVIVWSFTHQSGLRAGLEFIV